MGAKKAGKMALETEEHEDEASEAEKPKAAEKEEAAAPQEAAGEAEEKDDSDESSSAPVDVDDLEVDMVPNTETVVLGMGPSSSSSSSSSKSSVDPDELEVLPDPDGVEMTGERKDVDKVELVKRIRNPMRSPALTTPGDISSTDSSDSSSDSPVREVAGDISDGEGTGPKKRHACIVPIRKPAGIVRRMPKIVATAAVPIGLDEVGDGGAVASDDDVVLD